jgi:hypothetical protein
VRRKLGLVLAFLVFGLVAGASGLAVFMADLDRDPKHAMALAPAEAPDGATSSISTKTTETEGLEATWAEKTSKAAEAKSPCRENIRENSAVDCPSGKKRKPHSILALNERPAIAAVPIGRRNDPTVLPPEPAAPVVDAVTAAPTETPPAAPASSVSLPESAITATPTDTPSAEPAPQASPAVAPTKTRERNRDRGQRYQREHHEYASTPRYHREHREYASTPRYYSNRQVYQSAGYARLW